MYEKFLNKENRMKAKIEIVLGFLSSGKTNFINSMLENLKDETIVIIQNEFGETEIKYDYTSNNSMVINILNDTQKAINKTYLEEILSKYSPNRIFIEVNSFTDPNIIINLFNNDLKKLCKIDNITTMIDAENFNLYFKNMSNIFSSQIVNSNKIILCNFQDLDTDESSNIIATINSLNENVQLLEYSPSNDAHKYHMIKSNFNPMFLIFITILMFGIFSILMFSDILNIQYVSKFHTIFTSIFIEGIPFILIGSFISAIIQVCISENIFCKIFSKNIFISCIIASLSGFFFPICDCGIIPITKGLMKRNVPYGACITFMLSAPIVNPISITSTIYAFQNMQSVVICRIASGILISIIVGLIMHFLTKKDNNIFKNDSPIQYCSCGLCSNQYSSYGNILDLIKTIFIHTGDEFFNVAKLMIIGVFLSSTFQTVISINNMYIPKDNRTSLIFMIILSFILSVCSSSDAFIAKSFINYVSINSIMGFLICGPMIDLKNTLILLGNFKRKFVFRLIFFIIVISFSLIININIRG